MKKNAFSDRRNINYESLYQIFISAEKRNEVVPFAIPPEFGVIYHLCSPDLRASVTTLNLRADYKKKCAIPHLIENEILVSQAFYSKDDDSHPVYCAWREVDPNIISLWQRHSSDGLVQVPPSCFAIDGLQFSKQLTAKLPAVTALPTTCLILHNPEIPVDSMKLDSVVLELQVMASKREPKIEDSEMATKLNDINQTLRCMLNDVAPIEFFKDSEYDPSGYIRDYRMTFHPLEEMLDIIFTSFQSPWRNLDKELLMELKSEWERAIATVLNFPSWKSLSKVDWLPAMWLQVIGCPAIVRTQEELVALTCEIVLPLINSQNWTEEGHSLAAALQKAGFRGKFANWLSCGIVTRIEYFEEDLWEISEPISWNSFLFSDISKVVKYTHLHIKNGEYARKEGAQLHLKVVDNSLPTKTEIGAVPLSWPTKLFYPKDFAQKVFDHIQEKLREAETLGGGDVKYCFYGHSTSEQSVVKMSKYGMSPYAGCLNAMSCGHGMYFFKMNRTDFTFEEMNMGAGEKVTNSTIAAQFRGFLYAVSRSFQMVNCHALSPAVLLFLVKEMDISSGLDTITTQLPLRDSCSCPSAISSPPDVNIMDPETVDIAVGQDVCTNDVVRAVRMIDVTVRDGIEKFNTFALLSGAVDMEKVASSGGIYKGNVCDNSAKRGMLPYFALKSWSEANEFNVWKEAIRKPMAAFRRMVIGFDYSGCFIQRSAYAVVKKGRDEWSQTEIDPVYHTAPATEYVFVSVAALAQLLENSLPSVCFVDPDVHFRPDTEECFTKEDVDVAMTMTWAENRVEDKLTHAYWRLKSRCRRNGCV